MKKNGKTNWWLTVYPIFIEDRLIFEQPRLLLFLFFKNVIDLHCFVRNKNETDVQYHERDTDRPTMKKKKRNVLAILLRRNRMNEWMNENKESFSHWSIYYLGLQLSSFSFGHRGFDFIWTKRKQMNIRRASLIIQSSLHLIEIKAIDRSNE